MPLLIDLKPGEKVIINGAVLENAGTNTKIRICNESTLLRQKEIMTEEEANSPASRVYYCLQNAYLFPHLRAHYLGLFDHYLTEYLEACPSAEMIGEEICNEIRATQYYRALKSSRKLMAHEATVLDGLRRSGEHLAQALDPAPEADHAAGAAVPETDGATKPE